MGGDERTEVLKLFDKYRQDRLAHLEALKPIDLKVPEGIEGEFKVPEKEFKTPQEKAEYQLRQAEYRKKTAEIVKSICESSHKIERCLKLKGHRRLIARFIRE